MITQKQAPTRAAVLELMSEQEVVREAYVFLDEKRLLLASELLRQLRRYQQVELELNELHRRAREAMELATRHHGLDGLQVYPAATPEGAELKYEQRNYMGVMLIESWLTSDIYNTGQRDPVNPSAAAEHCRRLHCEIVQKSAVQAGLSGNLYRLLKEYRVTERRSRALENVILPEIEQSLRDMSSHLEELDMEDIIRVRLQSTRNISGPA